MYSLLKTKGRDLSADERGNFAIFSALAAAPILILIASGVSYSNAVTLRAKTQAAADAAVLAASVAYANGQATTAQQAQTIAANVFSLNAPAAAQASGAFTPVATIANSTITTAATFSGSVPSLVSSVVGDLSINVNATASASQGAGSGGPSAGKTGTFIVAGDPHFLLGSTQEFSSPCEAQGGAMYTSLYSDRKLQVNGQCWMIQSWEQAVQGVYNQMIADLGPRAHPSGSRQASIMNIAQHSVPPGDVWGMSNYAITVADHKISFTMPYRNPQGFDGSAIVDGRTIGAPANKLAEFILLDDSNTGVKLVRPAGTVGSLVLTTPEYSIGFYPDMSDNFGLDMYVTMKNGAVCGTPGGMLGQLAGQRSTWDTNYLDFDIGKWGLNPQYSATCDVVASAGVKLIK